MRNHRTFTALIALTLMLALLSTAALSTLAQAENTGDFSLIETADDAEVLSIREIAAKTRTSVVAIETETRVVYNNYDNYYSPFGGLFGYGYGYGYGYPRGGKQREYTQTSAGSGVIISDDGYIVTNNHVISGADKITVYVMPEQEGAEEETYEATLVGTS